MGIAEAAQQFVITVGTYSYAFDFFAFMNGSLNSRQRGGCTFNFLNASGQLMPPAMPLNDCYGTGGTVAPIRWAGK